MCSSISELIEAKKKEFGSEELVELVLERTLNQQDLSICKLIVDNNIRLLDKTLHDNETTLQDINQSYEDKGFDVLLFAIKSKVTLDMIKYIVETTPYEEINYGKVKNKDKFSVPLFAAIGNNDFEVADYLIDKGARLDYEFRSQPWNLDSEYVLKPSNLRYCGMEDQSTFGLSYNNYIQANIVSYLQEFDCLNQQNKNYLEKKGITVKVNKDIEARKKQEEKEIEEKRERLIKKYFKKTSHH